MSVNRGGSRRYRLGELGRLRKYSGGQGPAPCRRRCAPQVNQTIFGSKSTYKMASDNQTCRKYILKCLARMQHFLNFVSYSRQYKKFHSEM